VPTPVSVTGRSDLEDVPVIKAIFTSARTTIARVCPSEIERTLKMTELLLLAGLGSVALIAYTVTRQEPGNASQCQDGPDQEVLDLAAISAIWRESSTAGDAVNPKALAPVPAAPRNFPVFHNQEIAKFYCRHLFEKRQINDLEWVVLIRILELLDTYGGCPSVVCKPDLSEPDRDLVPDAMAVLAHIPLWQHSLAVAEDLVKTTPYPFLAARDLIVALAHDIGKIPGFHDGTYYTGEHPGIATGFLHGITEFTRLPNCAELVEAIRDHHSRVKEGTLSARLKQSDHQVRQLELSRLLVPRITWRGDPEQGSSSEPVVIANAEEIVERDPWFRHYDDYADTRPRFVDISDWFQALTLIEVMKEQVNQVTGGWWNAVSTPDGYVFCCAKGLYNLLHRAFCRQPALLAAYANAVARQDILYSVVMTLASDYGVVAIEHLDAGEYLCPVSITTGGDKIVEGKKGPFMMTPFRAQALGLNTYQLEVEKSQTIRRMVKTITVLAPPNHET
jgi:hypothetical protein